MSDISKLSIYWNILDKMDNRKLKESKPKLIDKLEKIKLPKKPDDSRYSNNS